MMRSDISLQQSGGSGSERAGSSSDVMAPLKVDTSGNVTNEGPPTPTHSETQDCIDARKCKTSPHSHNWSFVTGSLANCYSMIGFYRQWLVQEE